MIEIEVIQSQNKDFLGTYKFHKNLIYIGSNHEADLYFPKSCLGHNHLFIEVIHDKLITHLHQEVDHILVNGKRTTNFKTLYSGDKISFSDLEFKIKRFKHSEIITKKDLLNKAAAEIPQTRSELIPILSKLSEKT
ncbi:MAG: hypothetical protein CME62_02465 [Halobacteriovoraceae bacterium]|nr:hypothetical protein [Halobacteriovoraceae bacterium]|tara:strand:- start:645 stop:1052 length:408 start_codon:yes stop_codon:yes gene_type:complete